jgi:hypothetical protein
MTQRNLATRWAIGTLAMVAIALSVDSIRRAQQDMDQSRDARTAIRSQLDAFNRGDYRAAYRFAAPEIQEQFPLPQFREMVERGYPQLARSRKATFGEPDAHDDQVSMPVTVTGQDGVTVRVVYSMRREPRGWRVAGVMNEPPSGAPPGGEKPPTPPGPRKAGKTSGAGHSERGADEG